MIIACDVDDMSPEYLAAAADGVRADGALDVVLVPVLMKKGRAGTRIEVVSGREDAARLEARLLRDTTTIGVRTTVATRRVLARREDAVTVLGHSIRLKVVDTPDGTSRSKPEFDDVQRAALATNRRSADIYHLALAAAERR